MFSIIKRILDVFIIDDDEEFTEVEAKVPCDACPYVPSEFPAASEVYRTQAPPPPPDPYEYLFKDGWEEEPTPEEASVRLFYKIEAHSSNLKEEAREKLKEKTKRRALRHFQGGTVKHRFGHKTSDSIELKFHRHTDSFTRFSWRRELKLDNPLNM